MKIVGVNIGALSVKIIALKGAEQRPEIVAHHGRPLAVLKKLLAEKDFADADYFGVSGHLGPYLRGRGDSTRTARSEI